MTHPFEPSAAIAHLKKRAQLLQKTRAFFMERDVLEVETPLMCHTSVTDPAIESIPVLFRDLSKTIDETKQYYLQTSPEYAMKRLLAAGAGSIYQISKAFRQGEIGRFHNPEFTMLEWYRVGFDHHALMDETCELLQTLLNISHVERISYQNLFERFIGVDPHKVTISELQHCAKELQIDVSGAIALDKAEWLNVLMSHVIEPKLGKDFPCFVYDFPVELSALARIMQGDNSNQPDYAARFEVYYKGIELANGFYELCDADEQRKRFLTNLAVREKMGLSPIPIDEYFLAALQHGVPDCAGVALGFDRLVMLALGLDKIQDVLSFDFKRV